jgi:GNAT superfamily N-acetyltransferase
VPRGDAESSVTDVIRRAVPADAAALVVLRAAMYEAMGEDAFGPEAPWRADAAAWFDRELRRTREVAAFVADVPGAGVVASALGLIEHPVPSPANPAGERGHVSQVSTLPAHRHRGYARGCLVALLDWYGRDTLATRIDLNATGDGEPLYRSLGFAPSPYAALRLRLHR